MTDLALQNGLPASPDAERFLLASVFYDGDYGLISATVSAEDFSLEKHRRIYLRMGELYARGESIGLVSLANELLKHDQLESVEGVTYLSELIGYPQIVDLDGYVRIVKEKSILRRAIFQAQRMIDRCLLATEDVGDVLSGAEAFLRQLSEEKHARSDEFKTYGEIIEDCGGINALGQKPDPGIQTPFASLNREIVGLLPGDLAILGARPSSGKSAMAQQIGHYVANRHGAVALFSLEQGMKRVLMRGISEASAANAMTSPISTNEIRNGRLSDTQRASLLATCTELAELPMYTNTKARTSAAIYAALRRLKARADIKLVIIDHLHEMRSTGKQEKRMDELRRITSDIKLMLVDLNLPGLLLAQLSRLNERESRKPVMSDLRECGDVEQIADIVMLLHSKEEMAQVGQKKPVTEVLLLLAKQRDGARYLEIPLLFWGKQFRFTEATAQERIA